MSRDNTDNPTISAPGSDATPEPASAPGPKIVCWGEVLWDLFPDARRLGGALANVAYHLALFGERVALASRVGDDEFGREALQTLTAHGIDTSTVQVDRARPTGRVEVSLHGREPSYRLVPGCAWEHIQVTESVERALSSASAFCFGTLSQRNEISHFQRALTHLPERCVRVCDVNVRPQHIDFDVLTVALQAADVVKLNEQEASTLAERASVDDVCAWLFDRMHVEVVARTLGERGCVLQRRGQRCEHPGYPVGGTHSAPDIDAGGGDNVGAGDAFTAVLVHALLAGRELSEIADTANQYAAYVASQAGATPAIPASVLAAIREYDNTSP